jgi:hypothetical protein
MPKDKEFELPILAPFPESLDVRKIFRPTQRRPHRYRHHVA